MVDAEGHFLTQKKQPRMARVAQELEIDHHGQALLTLTAPDMPELKLTNHVPDHIEKSQVK